MNDDLDIQIRRAEDRNAMADLQRHMEKHKLPRARNGFYIVRSDPNYCETCERIFDEMKDD
jgi:hypothetical protein